MKCYFRFNRYFNMYIEYTWVGGKCMSTRHRPKTIYSNCIVLSMAKFLPNLGSYNQTPLHHFFFAIRSHLSQTLLQEYYTINIHYS
jgi:hypothetical protein